MPSPAFASRCAAALLALAAALTGPRPAAAQPVAIELLLAVDSSSSIDRNEFDQQLRGLAEAFRSPLVGAAVANAGGVAVALMQWSGRHQQHLSASWRILLGPEDARAFAAYLDETPRFVDGGSTAIGQALLEGLASLRANGYAGRRLVIDISGDGKNNEGPEPGPARDLLVAAGVTVNGLAILNEDEDLLLYYRAQVIGGPGAFALSAEDYRAYGAAIEYKLLQELGPPQFVDGPPAPPGGAGESH